MPAVALDRMVVQFRKKPITKLFIEWARLVAAGLQKSIGAFLRDRILLRRCHEACCVAAPAPLAIDPERSHVEPSAPNIAEQSSAHGAAWVFDEKSDRVVLRKAGCRHVVLIDAPLDRLGPRPRRIQFHDNFWSGHSRLRGANRCARTALPLSVSHL